MVIFSYRACLFNRRIESSIKMVTVKLSLVVHWLGHGFNPSPGRAQARVLEWGPFPSSGDLPNPGIKSLISPVLADGFFYTSATWEALAMDRSILSILFY